MSLTQKVKMDRAEVTQALSYYNKKEAMAVTFLRCRYDAKDV